jgi:hypothetical protein
MLRSDIGHYPHENENVRDDHGVINVIKEKTYCPSGSTAAGPFPLSTPVIVLYVYVYGLGWVDGMYKYKREDKDNNINMARV